MNRIIEIVWSLSHDLDCSYIGYNAHTGVFSEQIESILKSNYLQSCSSY